MAGLKLLWQDLMNQWKIKRGGHPAYMIYLMQKIFNVLEDVYSVGTVAEIQEAIDEIGTDAGTIFIESGTYDITVPIDIDNCGSIVIYGHGDNTILKPADGIIVFNITCCSSLLIKTLKIDASNYTVASINLPTILVNETLDNVVGFSDVTIEGLNNFGRGIELQSNNCIIEHCNITFLSYGVNIIGDSNIISQNTLSLNEIGIYHSGSFCTITGNTCSSNTTIGIYVVSQYSNISNNTCNFNPSGISINGSNNNTISNNITSSNTFHGIYMIISNYNTISGNTSENNDSNSAINTAGIYIAGNCDFNTISANSSNNNNNIGAGIAYGIFIAAVTCNENMVAANNANGNDIDFMDSGTATTITYYVQDSIELQDAIDSIGTKAGIINIDASFTVSATIDIDGGGSYIIQGEGSNSTLTTVGDIQCFNITSVRSCLLQNFKIDASSLTTNTREIINVSEVVDNIITIDNIEITGDGTNGYGIETNSDNCRIENCTIDNIRAGIKVSSSYNILKGNNCSNCINNGIQVDNGDDYNNLTSNICTINRNGIVVYSDYNIILGNMCNTNTRNGVNIIGGNYNSINNNICDENDCNVASDVYGGIIIDTDSNNNSIIGNTSINNNNIAVGFNSHGICIGNANCDENIIEANNCSGNDVQYWDLGTKTQITYYVSNEDDLQDALDSIAVKSAIINIQDSFNITATININGGGSYIIQGEGSNSILTTVGDITCFNITDARSCLLQNFKIVANSLTTNVKEIIDITEAADNIITINNITIDGDGTNGRGIEINSDNCRIENCNIIHVRTGIDVVGEYNIIQGNNCSLNNYCGIILYWGHYNNLTSNICNTNFDSGIVIDNANNNIVIGNIIRGNDIDGIKITGSDDNNINGNACDGNDSNTANPQAGIYITTDSNNNSIISNIATNNNNAGAGTGYGVYIATVDCIENIVRSNNISGNDVQWKDIGLNSDFEYRCSTAAEIQDAIDSIAAKSGTVHILPIAGGIQLSATININGGGDYVIEGEGVGTVIDCAGDRTAFDITSARSCILRDFKIDCEDVSTDGRPVIDINEAGDNRVYIENITIIETGEHGYGINIQSDNCIITNCDFSGLRTGVYLDSSQKSIISNNKCDAGYVGLQIYTNSHNTLISGNTITNNTGVGMVFSASDYCIFIGNVVNNNTGSVGGISISDSHYTVIVGNSFYDNDCDSILDLACVWLPNNSTYTNITGNTICNNQNIGAGTMYSIRIDAGSNFTSIGHNLISGNDNDSILDNGTKTEATSSVPIGVIWMYNGAGIANAAARTVQIGDEGADTIKMYGWFVCNGNSGTPDLVDKFIRSESASGNVAGSDDAVVVAHKHKLRMENVGGIPSGIMINPDTTVSVTDWACEEAGVSGVNANIPAYYSLIFIIRMNC